MLRQIALDTETTGKSDDGTPGDHRIIEIGCIEIIDRKITDRSLQFLLNPDREVDPEAAQVHGITWDMLKDKPRFPDIVNEFVDFIRGSELLIHNAKFDVSFLNNELALMNYPERIEDMASVTDTIAVARKLHPGHLNNLDNLCRVFGVDNSNRKFHGALLDASLLAEVYIAMTSAQTGLISEDANRGFNDEHYWVRPQGMVLPRLKISQADKAVHIYNTVKIAQNNKLFNDGQQDFAGSNWGKEFNMPLLVKSKEEGKKDFQKRQSEQREQILSQLLSEEDRVLLNQRLKEDKEAYDEWEARVMGKKPQEPSPY